MVETLLRYGFSNFFISGAPNRIPLTYVDNCAEAIVLAGIRPAGSAPPRRHHAAASRNRQQ
jgi:hypothetical protein